MNERTEELKVIKCHSKDASLYIQIQTLSKLYHTKCSLTYIVSDGFLYGKSLIVDVLGVPDGEDGVGDGALGQAGPGHLE